MNKGMCKVAVWMLSAGVWVAAARAAFPAVECGAWSESAAVRMDGRGGLAGHMVHGREWFGTADGEGGAWVETGEWADGWRNVGEGEETVGILALNAPEIAVEGGRLAGNTTWGAEATHVLRHHVVVGNGQTLTVGAGAVVKVPRGASIRVEDGGRVHFAGTEGNEAVVTGIGDAERGAVVDCGVWTNEGRATAFSLQSGAAQVTDDGGNVRFGFNPGDLYPTVKLQNGGGKRSDGVVRIPVTVAGTARTNAFRVDWEAVDGSAVYGEDYLAATGMVRWAKSAEGTKTIEIPVNPELVRGSNVAFTVRLTARYACNVGTAEAEAVVREFDFPEMQIGEWSGSAAVRFEGREGLAGRVVHGREWFGTGDGEGGEWTETGEWPDGWREIGDGGNAATVLSLNSEELAVEGGRLAESVTWGSNVTHVVRNTVVVGSGKTLTIGAGAVVKFLPGTVIRVEDGGKLAVQGASGADVLLTSVQDGRYGAAIDCGEWAQEEVGPGDGVGGIVLQSGSASFADNGWVETLSFRHGAYPYVKLNDTVAFRDGGMAYVPVSIASGSRAGAFSVDWVAVDGTARFGEDYLLAGGTISWTNTSQGTKTLQIPLGTDAVKGETTSFTLKLATCRACNASGGGECMVTIRELDKIAFGGGTWSGSGAVRFDGRGSVAGRTVNGREWFGKPDGGGGSWTDTADWGVGWKAIGEGEKMDVLSLNAPDIAVEGGRLAENTTWDSNAVHWVRHWVVVPSGKTLTLGPGAEVRLMDDAGIRVEDGGRLSVQGADGADVAILRGGAEALPEVPENSGVAEGAAGNVVFQSGSATFADNGWFQASGVGFAATNYGSVSVHDAEASRKCGVAYVAVTVGGNARNSSFAVDWEAVPGTATEGRDYTLGSGRLTWGKSSEGTKWIAVPLNTETVAGERRRFKVRLKAVHGMAGTGREATVEIREYEEGDALSGRGGEVVFAEPSEPSAAFAVEEGIGQQPIFRHDTETVRYSGAWQEYDPEKAAALAVTLETDNGKEVLKRAAPSEEGAFALDLTKYPVGFYTLRHDILDAGGGTLATMRKTFSIVDRESVEVHGGTLAQNETWTAGKVHVVYQTVVVPSVYTLFIEPGAVVKFMTGAGIDISQGGAFFANGIVFTHINDDTVGGDTLNDGYTVAPPMDAYHLTGAFTFGDDTELRGITQDTALTGTISGKKTLSRGSTYRVTGTLTVASGGDLTIPAGTVLKMESGASIVVNSGGTLNAPGSRAAPIVITSIKDDSYSGDTNKDGDKTMPQPGDWVGIKVAGGTALFEHVALLYASRNSATGAINMTGGTVVFDSGEIAHGLYDAVGVESGNFYMTNSVIRDCLQAFRHWAKDPIVNCVIYDCGRLTQGGGQHFYNCVFSRIAETWEAFGFPQNGTTYNNCCFWNEGGSVLTGEGTQDAMTVCGQNGNIWGNPLFVDPENGDFRIIEGSPCVDAADGEMAPETDFFGQPRITLTGVGEAGGLVGQLPDIGICEVMPRDVTSDIDLLPRNVRTASNAVPGQLLFVKWEVANAGGSELDAAWRDTVSLVSESGREVVLGDKTTVSRIASGGSAFCSGYFTVSAISEGTWYPKVNVNSYHDIFEGALTANNALTGEEGVEVALEALEPSVARTGVVQGGVPTVLKLRFGAEDEDRMVKFRVLAGVTVAWGFGFVPQGTSQSGGTSANGSASGGATAAGNASGIAASDGMPVQFLVPAEAEDVYVVLESSTSVEYEMATVSGKLAVTSVDPGTVPSSGETTLMVSGAGFMSGASVKLAGSGATIAAESVRVVDSRTISATVDCGKLAAGAVYDVVVESAGESVTAKGAVKVAEAPGKGEFWARLVVPESVREGRKVACSVEYGNSGNADMAAPVIQIAMKGSGTLGYVDGLQGVKTLQFVAAGEEGNAGVLRPGAERRIQFELLAGKDNRMTLHTSVGSDYAPEPWGSAEEYLADLSAAATRVGLRGRDATDYEEVVSLARAEKKGERVGVIHGTVVNSQGEKVSSGTLMWTEVETTNRVLATVANNGHFVTPPLFAGEWIVSSMDGGRLGSDGIPVEKNDDGDIQVAPIIVDNKLSAKVKVSGMEEGTLFSASATLAGSDTVVSACSDENGVVLFRGLENGVWRFSAEVDGKAGVTYVSIEEDAPCVEVSITLAESVAVAGWVNLSKWSGASGVCFIPEEGVPVLAQVDGSGRYEVRLPKGFYVAAPLGVLSDDAWIECEISEACSIDFDPTGTVASVAAKNIISLPRSDDRYDLWFWEVRGEAEKRYDEALRLIGAAIPIAPPPEDARCIHNLERYLQYRQEAINFSNESVAFIEAYGATDPYKLIAYISKAIGDGASVFAAFYTRAKANMALRNWHKYAGGIYNLRAAVAGGAVNFTAEQLKKLNSEVDSLETALSDLKSMLENPVVSMEWVRALNATTGRIQSLLSSIDLLMAGVNLLSGGATGQITGVVSAVLSVVEFTTDVILAADAGMDWWDGINKMRALLPVFDRTIARFKLESASFGVYDLHCCDELLPDEVFDNIVDKICPVVPQSIDPNEMAGPLGAGERRLVAPGDWMTYTVYFENKSDATAAAQEVYVTEALGGALDWSTFEMVDLGFNNQLDLGLGGKRKGASETAMAGTAYKVRTELDYSAKTGVANWYMRIVDEATETRWPRDVYAGFLPPNDATGRGEGHITYRVKLRDDAAAGTVVRASASIVFDYNAAIETDPAWWNTVAEMGTATVDLGNGVETNVTVMVGAPWEGQLPDPGKRQGMRFVGWFTGPNGTGAEVTAESLVAAGAKLYAFWDASAAPELWLDVSWGAVEIGTNGVEKGYAPDGNSVAGIANRYVLTGTSRVHGVKISGGSFTNTWTNLVIDLNAKDTVAVALDGANVAVEMAGDNSVASGEDCAGIRVDAKSALVLQGTGRLVARGGKCGAGIGGGKLQESGRIEVRAGTVEAYGGEYGAGIGGGLVAPAAGAVVITGGSVKARGSDGGEDIGGGFGREGTGVPVGAGGAEVHEVEVPWATDTLPAEVVVELGNGTTYRYAGSGHEGDTSLWFWLPDGTYEFEADGDDYGTHVAGKGTAAVFTDPGSTHFVAPPLGEVGTEADGSMRAAMNPAYRTTPFEVWSATELDGATWNWSLLPADAYAYDPTNAVIRIPNDTNQMRMLRFLFLPRRQ